MGPERLSSELGGVREATEKESAAMKAYLKDHPKVSKDIAKLYERVIKEKPDDVLEFLTTCVKEMQN